MAAMVLQNLHSVRSWFDMSALEGPSLKKGNDLVLVHLCTE